MCIVLVLHHISRLYLKFKHTHVLYIFFPRPRHPSFAMTPFP